MCICFSHSALLSIHLSTHPYYHLYPGSHPSTCPFTDSLSIYPSICPFIHLPIHPSSTYPPTHSSILPLTHSSIHHLSIHPPLQPPIHPPIHPPVHPSVHHSSVLCSAETTVGAQHVRPILSICTVVSAGSCARNKEKHSPCSPEVGDTDQG